MNYFSPRVAGIVIGLFVLFLALPTSAAPAISTSYSTIGTDKASVNADGIDQARINVVVKNTNLLQISGANVTLQSSRGALDEITPPTAVTSLAGRVTFLVRSLKNGASTYSAIADGVPLGKTIQVSYSNGLILPLDVGDLIKIPDDGNASTQPDSAVYYYASNGRRYVFPNEKVYASWYPDFNYVKTIPIDQMSLIPIGGNVTYRPGSTFVKFQTDVKTYVPTKGGVLRWIQTEEVARGYYGANWNQRVDDISEGFYTNYTMGTPIANYLDLALDMVQSSTKTINANLGLGAP